MRGPNDDAEHLFRTLSSRLDELQGMVTGWPECLLVKQHGLLRLVALLIYKMINSGKLSYTSVVKHGRVLKLLIRAIRRFGSS